MAEFGQAASASSSRRRRSLAAAAAVSFGQLTSLSLANNRLDGTLTSSLFRLTGLVYLDLSNNAMRCARARKRRTFGLRPLFYKVDGLAHDWGRVAPPHLLPLCGQISPFASSAASPSLTGSPSRPPRLPPTAARSLLSWPLSPSWSASTCRATPSRAHVRRPYVAFYFYVDWPCRARGKGAGSGVRWAKCSVRQYSGFRWRTQNPHCPSGRLGTVPPRRQSS